MVLPRTFLRFAWVACLLVGAGPARAVEKFAFVVIGDTRSAEPVLQPPAFLQARDEINFLKPAFVVNLGNVIAGPTEEQDLLGREWEAFEKVRRSFTMSHYLVVGSDDVFDAASQQAFMRRYGALWYSFDYGGCHFVVLDSEVVGQRNRIAGEQLTWLKGDLERNKQAACTFVFVHKPLWREWAARDDWWANVHPLLAQSGVDMVFAGHRHEYRRDVDRDGVRYYVSGGGGAPLARWAALGGFHHYMWVTVEGAKAEAAVIRTGWLHRDDVVTVEKVRAFRQAMANVLTLSTPIPFSLEPAETDVTAVLKNEFDQPWSIDLSWKVPRQFAVEPGEARLDLAAGESRTLHFRLHGSCWPMDFMPTCVVAFEQGATQRSVSRAVQVARQLDCPFAGAAPEIDGVPKEPLWAKAGVASRFYNDADGGSSELDTRAMVLWDREHLYVAMVVPEPHTDQLVASATSGPSESAWQDDSVEVFLDPGATGRDSWELVVNSRGAFMDNGPDQDLDWNPQWQRAAHVGEGSWSVEMAIPFAAVGVSPKAGDVWGINFCRNRQVKPAEGSAWSQAHNFHDASRYGRLRFVGPAETQ